MHVCKKFVETGSCKRDRKCKYSHNIMEQQPQYVLKKYGINVNREPSEILEELRAMYAKNVQEGANGTGVSGGMFIIFKLSALSDSIEYYTVGPA